MILNDLNVDVDEFQREFEKKFTNFCKKSPIFLSYILTENYVDVYVHPDPNSPEHKKLAVKHEFDYSLSVKENIFEVRKKLVRDYYPLILTFDEIEEKNSPEELNAMVERGEITVDDIVPGAFRKTIEVWWRIERVLIMKDELFIRDMRTGYVYQYRIKMPVSIFLRRIYEKSYKERGELFASKSVFIRKIDEDEDVRNSLYVSMGGQYATN